MVSDARFEDVEDDRQKGFLCDSVRCNLNMWAVMDEYLRIMTIERWSVTFLKQLLFCNLL